MSSAICKLKTSHHVNVSTITLEIAKLPDIYVDLTYNLVHQKLQKVVDIKELKICFV